MENNKYFRQKLKEINRKNLSKLRSDSEPSCGSSNYSLSTSIKFRDSKTLKKEIAVLLSEFPEGIELETFSHKYLKRFGYPLTPSEYQYRDIVELLKSFDDLIRLDITPTEAFKYIVLVFPKETDMVKKLPVKSHNFKDTAGIFSIMNESATQQSLENSTVSRSKKCKQFYYDDNIDNIYTTKNCKRQSGANHINKSLLQLLVEDDKGNSDASEENDFEVPESITSIFKTIINSYGGGVSIDDILPEYEVRSGKKLNISQLGASSLLDLISHMKDFGIVNTNNSQYYLYNKDSKTEFDDILRMQNIEEFEEEDDVSQPNCLRNLSVDTTGKLTHLLVDEYPGGLSIEEIVGAFNGFYGATSDDLQPEKYGHRTLESLLSSESGTVSLIREHGKLMVFAAGHSLTNSGFDIYKCENYLSEKENLILSKIAGPKETFKTVDILTLFPCHQSAEVVVGEVYNPSKFWVIHRSVPHSQALDNMMDRMLEFYSSKLGDRYKIPSEEVNIGSSVVAYDLQDGNYYRAITTSREDLSTVKMFYVDYGTTCRAPISYIRYIHKVFFDLPAQAVKASLKNIGPLNGRVDWPKTTSKELLDLVQNAICHIEVHEYKSDQLIVTLSSKDQNISDVAAYLVSKNKASFKNLPFDKFEASKDYCNCSSLGRKNGSTERSDSPLFNPLEEAKNKSSDKSFDTETREIFRSDSDSSSIRREELIETTRVLNKNAGVGFKKDSPKSFESVRNKRLNSSFSDSLQLRENAVNKDRIKCGRKEVEVYSDSSSSVSKRHSKNIRKPYGKSSLDIFAENDKKVDETLFQDIVGQVLSTPKTQSSKGFADSTSNCENSFEEQSYLETQRIGVRQLKQNIKSLNEIQFTSPNHNKHYFNETETSPLQTSQPNQRFTYLQPKVCYSPSVTVLELSDAPSLDSPPLALPPLSSPPLESPTSDSQPSESSPITDSQIKFKEQKLPEAKNLCSVLNNDLQSTSYQGVFYSDEEQSEDDDDDDNDGYHFTENCVFSVQVTSKLIIHIVCFESQQYLPWPELSLLTGHLLSAEILTKLLKDAGHDFKFTEIFLKKHTDVFLYLTRCGAQYLFPLNNYVMNKLCLISLESVANLIPIMAFHFDTDQNFSRICLEVLSAVSCNDVYPLTNGIYANNGRVKLEINNASNLNNEIQTVSSATSRTQSFDSTVTTVTMCNSVIPSESEKHSSSEEILTEDLLAKGALSSSVTFGEREITPFDRLNGSSTEKYCNDRKSSPVYVNDYKQANNDKCHTNKGKVCSKDCNIVDEKRDKIQADEEIMTKRNPNENCASAILSLKESFDPENGNLQSEVLSGNLSCPNSNDKSFPSIGTSLTFNDKPVKSLSKSLHLNEKSLPYNNNIIILDDNCRPVKKNVLNLKKKSPCSFGEQEIVPHRFPRVVEPVVTDNSFPVIESTNLHPIADDILVDRNESMSEIVSLSPKVGNNEEDSATLNKHEFSEVNQIVEISHKPSNPEDLVSFPSRYDSVNKNKILESIKTKISQLKKKENVNIRTELNRGSSSVSCSKASSSSTMAHDTGKIKNSRFSITKEWKESSPTFENTQGLSNDQDQFSSKVNLLGSDGTICTIKQNGYASTSIFASESNNSISVHHIGATNNMEIQGQGFPNINSDSFVPVELMSLEPIIPAINDKYGGVPNFSPHYFHQVPPLSPMFYHRNFAPSYPHQRSQHVGNLMHFSPFFNNFRPPMQFIGVHPNPIYGQQFPPPP